MKILHAVLFAALALAVPARAETPAPPADSAATNALIGKMNAYVALLNRTLRAADSTQRYESWVKNMKSGPTGKERIVYGLYSLYDVRKEIEAARAAIDEEPAMPELDAAMPAYIASYEALAPIITEANGYYERQDYKDDKFAGAKELHKRLAPAMATFRDERAKVDVLFAVEKAKADQAELAMIEEADGRRARWHVANVMLHARQVVELFPTAEKPVVDMPVFEERVKAYAAAVREMDTYSAENPSSFHVFESRPRSFLGDLRDFREKLQKAKGDARKGAGNDLRSLVSDYNMMVSTSQTATIFSK